MLSNITERKFIETLELDEYEIWTDAGWEEISQIHVTVPYDEYDVVLEDGKNITVADTHIFFDDHMNEIYAKDCVGCTLMTTDGPIVVKSVIANGKSSNMYDIGVNSENHRYYTNDILSHNSITSVAWLLHYVIFNGEKKIGVLANKGATAREMLSRLTLMLENLPFFLQPGCKVLNKGSIRFSNNSEIIAAATSSSSIRGLSLNCVTGDTKICIYENDSIYHLEIDNFINKSKLVQKDMYYTVYKITNKINNKIYVGFHSTYNIDDGYMGSGKLIKRAIEKYGIDQFTKEILGIYNTKEEAEAEEKRIVDRDFTLRDDTYNLSVGGNICILHGKNNGFYGKKHSAESREKISKANFGRLSENAHKIIHSDGRIFHTIEKAIEELGYLEKYNNYASRVKVIYECGNPDGFLHYECPDIQQSAYEFYLKRNEMLENLPEIRKATGRIVSEKLKGRAKPAGFGEKISKALSGVPKSPEHIEKVNRNPEKIRKSAEKHRGMKRSDEAKMKMSHAKKGMIAKNKGKKFFTDPTDSSKKGYYFENEVPLGWVNKMMKK